ncbi:hypothetical protein OESDEN_02691 [Oesophagostomum dentatum]|uniref:Fibronectin type-III domain-containing protein n=1 Tax=Oesophagostomum dentatum TaxID=61180 RepID=A0A0B1TJ98_OESDE|nr:hypothetical protein OESDEN_02691 [Oesophagostomum dentatum]
MKTEKKSAETYGQPDVELFYIVNVKQLTSDSGTALHRQQIKTSANSFTLGKLIAGEKYEMTIRSALSPTKVSSTAAIVEIHMPKGLNRLFDNVTLP